MFCTEHRLQKRNEKVVGWMHINSILSPVLICIIFFDVKHCSALGRPRFQYKFCSSIHIYFILDLLGLQLHVLCQCQLDAVVTMIVIYSFHTFVFIIFLCLNEAILVVLFLFI